MKNSSNPNDIIEKLMAYKEGLPLQISVLLQLSQKEVDENLRSVIKKTLEELKQHQELLVDIDGYVMDAGSPDNIGSKADQKTKVVNNDIFQLIEEYDIKPDWPATAQWAQIKAEHLYKKHSGAIKGLAATAATAAIYQALITTQNTTSASDLNLSNSTSTDLQSSSQNLISSNPIYSLGAAAASALAPALSSAQNMLQNSLTLPNDNLQFWETHNLVKMLTAAMIKGNEPRSLAAFLLFNGFDILRVEAAADKKLVYCGPMVNCEHLLKQEYQDNVVIKVSSEGDVIQKPDNEIKVVILEAHGEFDGTMDFDAEKGSRKVQPDDFAKQYFPKAKIIHAFGCLIGSDLDYSFENNVLNPDQVMFIHAGSRPIADLGTKHHLLSQNPSKDLPIPIPLGIIFKDNAGKSVITKLAPPYYQDIKSAIKKDRKKDPLIAVFDKVEQVFSKQKEKFFSVLKNYPKQESLIKEELSKIGFIDPTQIDDSKKRELARNYLARSLLAQEFTVEEKIELVKSELIDFKQLPNNKEFNSILFGAVLMNQKELCEALLKQGYDPNTKTNDINSLFSAIYGRQYDIVELLVKSGADPERATYYGTAFDAIEMYVTDENEKKKMIDIISKSQKEFEQLKPCGSPSGTAGNAIAKPSHQEL